MRVVLQRVQSASVNIDGQVHAAIDHGVLILVGIEDADGQEDADWLASKISGLRIFNDDEDKMNLPIQDIQGDYLVISQFTLHASTKKGNRPSYIRAAKPPTAIPLYNYFIDALAKTSGRTVRTGVFGADMQVVLINDGPVTIMIDTKNKE
ncbi:MAG: D-tyrosyl-tRNA(Tyr) deacylase [Chitinophagales bacterium]|nr:D-tyrosyl-tRNA(Tyr) deacylase [Chitinophagales bacterium]